MKRRRLTNALLSNFRRVAARRNLHLPVGAKPADLIKAVNRSAGKIDQSLFLHFPLLLPIPGAVGDLCFDFFLDAGELLQVFFGG